MRRRYEGVAVNYIRVMSGKSAAVESPGWKLDETKLESREMDHGNGVKFSVLPRSVAGWRRNENPRACGRISDICVVVVIKRNAGGR